MAKKVAGSQVPKPTFKSVTECYMLWNGWQGVYKICASFEGIVVVCHQTSLPGYHTWFLSVLCHNICLPRPDYSTKLPNYTQITIPYHIIFWYYLQLVTWYTSFPSYTQMAIPNQVTKPHPDCKTILHYTHSHQCVTRYQSPVSPEHQVGFAVCFPRQPDTLCQWHNLTHPSLIPLVYPPLYVCSGENQEQQELSFT